MVDSTRPARHPKHVPPRPAPVGWCAHDAPRDWIPEGTAAVVLCAHAQKPVRHLVLIDPDTPHALRVGLVNARVSRSNFRPTLAVLPQNRINLSHFLLSPRYTYLVRAYRRKAPLVSTRPVFFLTSEEKDERPRRRRRRPEEARKRDEYERRDDEGRGRDEEDVDGADYEEGDEEEGVYEVAHADPRDTVRAYHCRLGDLNRMRRLFLFKVQNMERGVVQRLKHIALGLDEDGRPAVTRKRRRAPRAATEPGAQTPGEQFDILGHTPLPCEETAWPVGRAPREFWLITPAPRSGSTVPTTTGSSGRSSTAPPST